MHDSREIRITLIALVGFVLGVYWLLAPAHPLSTPDEELNFRTTLSLLEGHRGAVPPLPGGFASKQGIDGRQYAQYGLGVPLAAAPWCGLGRLIVPDEIDFGEWLQSAGPFSPPSEVALQAEADLAFLRQWMVFFTFIIAAACVALVYVIVLRCGVPPPLALMSALLYAFASYQWQHGSTFFTEPLATLGLLAGVWALLRWRETGVWKWVLLGGVFWAYAILTRLDTLVTAPAALWLMSIAPGNSGRIRLSIDWRNWLIFGAPIVLVLISILLYNQYRFDSFFSTGYEDQTEGIRFATPLLVGLHGFFFTPGRSLFLYTPPAVLAFWGLAPLWKRDRWLAGGLLLLVLGYLLVMSKWQNWAGGYDWGPRHLFQITPFLIIWAAVGWHHLRERGHDWLRFLVLGLALVGIGMQLLGLAIEPVEAIRTYLQRWPNESLGGALSTHAVMMQFMIYLPQFSPPVLHAQMLANQGADLLLIDLAGRGSAVAGWMLIPAAMTAGFGIALGKQYSRMRAKGSR